MLSSVIRPGGRLPMVRNVSLVGVASRNSDWPAGTSTETDGIVIRRFTPVTGVGLADRQHVVLHQLRVQRRGADREAEERPGVEADARSRRR